MYTYVQDNAKTVLQSENGLMPTIILSKHVQMKNMSDS